VRRQAMVPDVVRRGIDRLLASAVQGNPRSPLLTPRDLGVPTIPSEEWRDIANDRWQA